MPAPAIPQEVSLTLFGGMDTSLGGPTLPEGLSPACNDVSFGPGQLGSRPCLKKVFAAPFAGAPAPQALWGKKYPQANGLPLNLYLDSLGVLRQEDVVNSPGTYTTVAQLSSAARTFKSDTFGGVEYIATSDGIHPVYPPMFYDTDLGVFDRVSKDGVGTLAGTTIADINTTAAITSVTLATSVVITAAVSVADGAGLVLITYTTAAPHGIVIGQAFLVQGVAVAGYNGVFQASSIPTATTITLLVAGTALAASAGGTLGPATATIVTGTPHGMVAGDAFTFNGNAGTLNTGSVGNPTLWVVLSVTNATTFIFGLINNFGVLLGGQATTLGGAGGTLTPGGMISQGEHQLCVSFLWRGGYITKPSPPISWSSAGNKQAQITNLPVGPTGVIARILHFTGAGGGNFFSIPTQVKLPANTVFFGASATPVIINSTWILDNTTTTVNVDFPDNTLFAAAGSDIPGNNLFALVVLGPSLGFVAYASRVFSYGEFNKVQRLLNMGFEGGVVVANQPLGWTVPPAEFALVTGLTGFGLAGQITGDGSGNNKGLISQTAFQNYLFQPIVQPNTLYTFWCMAQASAPALAGNLIAELFSVSTGSLATATIAINTISTVAGKFYSAQFSAKTPAVIPADTILRVYENGLNNGATITYDESMMVFATQPYRDTLMRGSYVNNPESFDGLTGDIGSPQDPTPIRDLYQLRPQTLTLLTAHARHVTQDNNGEPGTWAVDQLEDNVGAASIHSATTGPNWAAWIQDTGKALALRVTPGGDSYKISREMKTYFKGVNMTLKHRSWLVNVDDESQSGAGIMFMGTPQGEAGIMSTAVLDYFESDTAGDIQSNRPLHIGFTGKMLSTDLGRKWTIWNLPLAFGNVLARSATVDQLVVGSGNTSFASGAFGNVYTFDPTKFTDDDYGQMFPAYTTYFFVNHDREQEMQLGGKRKFLGGPTQPLSIFITGVGIMKITPIKNTAGNFVVPLSALKPWALEKNQQDDIELPMEVSARRCAFKIEVNPLPGTTDVNFLLTHLTIPIMKHPVSALGGVNR